MWHDFLEGVTTRAAIFWMRWSRLSCSWGRPYNNEFAISKREVTKACTTCSEAVRFKYFRNRPILRRWRAEFRITFETWGFNDIAESNITPRLPSFGCTWKNVCKATIHSYKSGMGKNNLLQMIFDLCTLPPTWKSPECTYDPCLIVNGVTGAILFCYKIILQVNFNIWPQITFDLSMGPFLHSSKVWRSPKCTCDPSLVTIGLMVGKLMNMVQTGVP